MAPDGSEGYKTLTDGTVVDGHSLEWKIECLGRYISRLPRHEQRSQWVQTVESTYGTKAADQIRAVIMAEFQRR